MQGFLLLVVISSAYQVLSCSSQVIDVKINFGENVQRMKDVPLWLWGYPSCVTNMAKFHSGYILVMTELGISHSP